MALKRYRVKGNLFGMLDGQSGELEEGNVEVQRALSLGFLTELDPNTGDELPRAMPVKVGGCGCGS